MKIKNSPIILRLCAILIALINFIGITLYFFGTATFYNKSFGVFQALNMLFGIFNIDHINYYSLVGNVLSLTYFVILIYIFKNTISHIKVFFIPFFRAKEIKNNFSYLIWYTRKTLIAILTFVFISGWFDTYSLNTNAKLVCLCIALILFLLRIYFASSKNHSLSTFFTNIAYDIIFLSASACMLKFFLQPSIRRIVYNIISLFNSRTFSAGLECVYQIGEATTYIILCITAINIVNNYLQNTDSQKTSLAPKALTLIYTIVALFALSVAIYLINGNSIEGFKEIYNLCKPYLHMFILSVGVWLISFFSIESKKKIKKK